VDLDGTDRYRLTTQASFLARLVLLETLSLKSAAAEGGMRASEGSDLPLTRPLADQSLTM
jgi:hypothetical protein